MPRSRIDRMSFLRCAPSSLATRISLPGRPSVNDSVNAEAMTMLSSFSIIASRMSARPSHQVATFDTFSSAPSTARARAGAERIDEDVFPVAPGLQGAGDPEPRRGVELQRIGEIGIDPPQDHFG